MESFKDHFETYEGKKRVTVILSLAEEKGVEIFVAADPGKPQSFMDALKEAVKASKWRGKKYKIQEIQGLDSEKVTKIKKISEAFTPGMFLKENYEMLNYGELPKINDFIKHVQTAIDPDEDKPFLPKGKKYPYTLKGSDAAVADDAGIPTRANLNVKDLYKTIQKLVDAWEGGNDDAGDLASSMMFTLGYEWV